MTLINRPKPRSVSEAATIDAHDRIVSIAKNALQTYIASFLDTNGSNRSFTQVISKTALQYVTDKSLQDSPDPTKKPTQLARMFNEIRQRMPAIMIVDSGITWEEPGLGGGKERASIVNGNWQGWYRIMARVNVVVAAVTQDPESCSMLQNILSIMFKQMRREAGGNSMRSGRPGDSWEVRLPLNFSSTSNSPTNVADDAKDQIWASTIELELQAEDLFAIEKPIIQTIVDGGFVGQPNLAGQYPPVIEAPAEVKIQDGAFMVSIYQLSDDHIIAISDPTIATLNLDSMMVTPHRLGSFDILVFDTTQRTHEPPAKWAPVVVTQHTVQVKLR